MTALPLLRRVISSPARSAAIGAAGGALHGAVSSTPEEGWRSGALRGAIRGGVLGGTAGGLGRAYQNTRLLNPGIGGIAAARETASRLGRGAVNFGKRQIHGFTGAFDPNEIGMAGRVTAKKEEDLFRRRAKDIQASLPKARHAEHLASTREQVEHIRQQGEQGQRLIEAGVTSIPGIAKTLADPTRRGQALRAMGSTITSGGATLAVGVPLALAAPSLMKGDERATGGKSLGQKVKGLGLSFATGAATGGMPILPQLVAGSGLDYAAHRITGA